MTTRLIGPPPPRRRGRRPQPFPPAKPRAEPRGDSKAKRNVMDTLLGENDLAAFDAGGNDPYNATGRQFRR